MVDKNTWFTLASDKSTNEPGIRPNTNKMVRFNTVVPWFKTHKIWFPEELQSSAVLQEAITELTLASPKGFKSKHDDFIDTISMLGDLTPWKPSEDAVPMGDHADGIYDDDMEPEVDSDLDSYIV
jgi:hypothetical protein